MVGFRNSHEARFVKSEGDPLVQVHPEIDRSQTRSLKDWPKVCVESMRDQPETKTVGPFNDAEPKFSALKTAQFSLFRPALPVPRTQNY